MPKLIDITGRRYGELTVLERSEVRIKGRRSWLCICDCGVTCNADAYTLSIGDKTCCGNHRTKAFLAKHSKPNPSKRKYPEGADTKSRLWTIFRAMHLRCEKPSHPAYHRYGGRGITICEDWSHNFAAFSAWALANGYADDLTLDRIDNERGYEPSNCRWATRAEQALNTRSNFMVTAFGETKPASAWAADPRCKVSAYQCYKRIKSGHAPEFAMTASEHDVRSLASKAREAALKAKGYKNSGRPRREGLHMGREVNMDLDAAASAKADVPTGEAGVGFVSAETLEWERTFDGHHDVGAIEYQRRIHGRVLGCVETATARIRACLSSSFAECVESQLIY